MWRHHLAVWATHPLAHGWHRTIADMCRWPVLAAVGHLQRAAGGSGELCDDSGGDQHRPPADVGDGPVPAV